MASGGLLDRRLALWRKREKMEHWFKTEILKRVIDTHVPCQDSFIGMEIVQRPDKGTIGLCNLDWLSSNMQSSRSISRKLILSWKYRSDWEQGTGDGIWGWSQPCTEFTIPARVKWRKAHWHRSRPSGRSNNFVSHWEYLFACMQIGFVERIMEGLIWD